MNNVTDDRILEPSVDVCSNPVVYTNMSLLGSVEFRCFGQSNVDVFEMSKDGLHMTKETCFVSSSTHPLVELETEIETRGIVNLYCIHFLINSTVCLDFNRKQLYKQFDHRCLLTEHVIIGLRLTISRLGCEEVMLTLF